MSYSAKKLSQVINLIIALILLLVPSSTVVALGIVSVAPNLIVNSTDNTISIGGSDFQSGSVVSLDGYGPLSTTYVSPTTLTAVVPNGIPAGVYTVSVTNLDASGASLPNGMTVTEPAVTPNPDPFGRPQIVVDSYKANVSVIQFGQEFNLKVTIYNSGQLTASNVQASFTTGDLIPRQTGGVVAVGSIGPDNNASFSQPMTAAINLWGKNMVSADMTISYYDEAGTGYSEKFTLVLPLSQPEYVAPTATPAPSAKRPQLIISNYATDVSPLQPGTLFTLQLQLQNVGQIDANNIVMIVGGGSTSSGTSAEGTPQPGGVSGSSGEFTNFAPVNASNIQPLGNLGVGNGVSANLSLVVNVSTNPGAYPLKITLSYVDEKGLVYNDDQVITLLVYNLPKVELSFYRPLDPLIAGQPGMLPIQVVNLGRQSVILGNLRIEVHDATVENNQILVGGLEPGYPFTFDPTIIPNGPGKFTVTLMLDYTDDFNQPRSITQNLEIDVTEMMEEPPLNNEGEMPPVNAGADSSTETFWQKAWRFILGLLGLDSSRPGNQQEDVLPPPERPVSPLG
jgi:hypothetical protein